LGSAFIDAASHVFRSRPERLEAVDVLADQNVDEVRRIVREAIVRLDDGSGVLIMTDIIGGTPSNCCPQTGDANQVAVIAGISLPMLLRAITYRQDQLDVVVEMALAGGQNGATRIENRIRIGQS
jgi:PTS system ascorbate-specific IIA component